MPGPSSSTSRNGAAFAHSASCTVTRPPARRVLERVVDQVGERLAQQQRIARHLHVGEVETEVDFLRHRAVHPFVRRVLDDGAQVHAGKGVRAIAARLGARERQQLVGEARGADRREVDLLQLRAAAPRACPAPARFPYAPAGRRAACAADAPRWRGSAAGCRWTPPPARTAGSARPPAAAPLPARARDRSAAGRAPSASGSRPTGPPAARVRAGRRTRRSRASPARSAVPAPGSRARCCARACCACWWSPRPARCRPRRRRAPAARRRGFSGRGIRRRRRSRRPRGPARREPAAGRDRRRARSRPRAAHDRRWCRTCRCAAPARPRPADRS